MESANTELRLIGDPAAAACEGDSCCSGIDRASLLTPIAGDDAPSGPQSKDPAVAD